MTNETAPSGVAPRVAVAVLAAGHGKRMRSQTPKHIHPVGGVPLVERIIRAGLSIQPARLLTVVSPAMAGMPAMLGMQGEFETVIQDPPRGTADAVRIALCEAPEADYLVSLLGDNPLLTAEIVQTLVDGAITSDTKITILTCLLPDAQAYGRIHRDDLGRVTSIIEAKNDHPSQRIGETEINSGIMVLDAAWAREALQQLPLDPVTGEYLLTDLVEMAASAHVEGEPWPIATVQAPVTVSLGVNNRLQQAEADALVRRQVRERLMHTGVSMIGADTIFIDEQVQIGMDTVILPGTIIMGSTTIGCGCRIGPNTVLDHATIGDNVVIQSSTVEYSMMESGSDAGPYAHIRGGSVIGEEVHVGNYAELKNTAMARGAKVGHFSYLGDATVGESVNIGAGSVTANYDGTTKNRTVLERNVFVGSDTVFVAPVTVGEGAKTGAGSVVTRNVPPNTTVVGVPARQIAKRSAEKSDGQEQDSGRTYKE
ncbi:MAG TPA: bifunctional UDP-N-acetylglucosamine diphosphorylase/glucosamine-1-phosphate N-acetyltransferase GlmU [Thermomicrobiales bacterium]|nr:bifunctional UDP-N-acetylglucosamine diphosphorylase/glucosamine-1-phosphate N-acetyltransferase GlmU [Thermomicrobiales bacterium]